jgi:hypothetical protein
VAPADRTQRTYRLELQRAVANGVLESAGATFLLLIAVRWFDAGGTAKALVAGGGSAGLLLTPLVVSLVARRQWPAAQAAACFAVVVVVGFLLMAAVPWLPLYVLGSMVTMASASAVIPLMTQIYQENYPERRQRQSLPSHALRARRPAVPAHAGLLDAHGLREPDDAADARGVPGQSAARSGAAGQRNRLLASLLLLPEARFSREVRRGPGLTEEVSE